MRKAHKGAPGSGKRPLRDQTDKHEPLTASRSHHSDRRIYTDEQNETHAHNHTPPHCSTSFTHRIELQSAPCTLHSALCSLHSALHHAAPNRVAPHRTIGQGVCHTGRWLQGTCLRETWGVGEVGEMCEGEAQSTDEGRCSATWISKDHGPQGGIEPGPKKYYKHPFGALL
jgi:hypothetical protein